MDDSYFGKYVSVVQALSRYWIDTLTPNEVVFILFINERTYRFKKDSEVISVNHFINGVPNAQQKGLNVSRWTVQRTRTLLLDKGLIWFRGDKWTKGQYEINYKNVTEPLDFTGADLHNTGADLHHDRCTYAPIKYTDNKETDKTNKLNKSPLARRRITRRSNPNMTKSKFSDLTPDQIVDEVSKHNEQVRKKRVKSIQRSISASSIIATWEDAMIHHYGRAMTPPLLRSQVKLFKDHINKTKFSDDVGIRDIFDWVIEYWDELRTGEFKWVENIKSTPSLSIVIFLWPKFYDAYLSGQQRPRKQLVAVGELDEEKKKSRELQNQIRGLTQELDQLRKGKDTHTVRKKSANVHNRMRKRKRLSSGKGNYQNLPKWGEKK